MAGHRTGTRDEWLQERRELLKSEKEVTRLNHKVAEQRRQLPWVRVGKDYAFDTEQGDASLAGLFQGRSQLLVYHFMFGPDWDEGCPSCSSVADGFDVTHLASPESRCRVHRHLPGTARQAARLPGKDGVVLPMGFVGSE